jgi:hypothetical protein
MSPSFAALFPAELVPTIPAIPATPLVEPNPQALE